MSETVMEKVGRAAGDVGKGALAGLARTALMTISSTVEMKLRNREASDAPVKAAGKVLGVQPRNPEGAKRFGTYVHWSCGMAWGALGGLLHFALDEELATAAHFAAVWGAALTILPKLDVTPPPMAWDGRRSASTSFITPSMPWALRLRFACSLQSPCPG